MMTPTLKASIRECEQEISAGAHMRPIAALTAVMQSHFAFLPFSWPQCKGFGKKLTIYLTFKSSLDTK
jgi:hypothetical protein